MRKMYFLTAVVILGIFLASIVPVFAPAEKASDAIWADDQIWDTVLTPATFKKPNNLKSVDKLYVLDGSGLLGQRPVAEAAPYEDDYNGGRWWVQSVVFTSAGKAAHDPDGDGLVNFELKSNDQLLTHLSLGHFTITPTDTFFVCPLVTFEK